MNESRAEVRSEGTVLDYQTRRAAHHPDPPTSAIEWLAQGGAAIAAAGAIIYSTIGLWAPPRRMTGLVVGVILAFAVATALTYLAAVKDARHRHWLHHAMRTLVAAGILTVFPGYGMYRLERAYGSNGGATKAKCASNMKQIAMGLQLYAQDHAGAFPGDFSLLITHADLGPVCFVCQAGDEVPAPDVASFRLKPVHCSYVYRAAGLTAGGVTAGHVLAHERLDVHGRGSRVLWGDGTVTWLGEREARRLISKLDAGINPPQQ